MATRPVTTLDILDGHVSLDIECLDRIYFNGYVPNLQVGGQVVQFLAAQGFPIPSPAVVNRIGERFRGGVRRFAQGNRIPVVRFARGDRKIDVMRPAPGPAGRDRPVRGGGDRGGAGVPTGGHLQRAAGLATAAPRTLAGIGPSGGCRVSTST